MVAQLEEQRPESDKQQHDARIVIIEHNPVKYRLRNISVDGGDSRG